LDYSVRATLSNRSDVDYFRVHAPQAGANQTVNLVVSATGLGDFKDLQLQVFDAKLQPVAAQVLTSQADAKVIQIEDFRPDEDYYIRVSGDANKGSYTLAADFTTQDISYTAGLEGTVSAAAPIATTLHVSQSQTFQFMLSAGSGTDVAAEFTVT